MILEIARIHYPHSPHSFIHIYHLHIHSHAITDTDTDVARCFTHLHTLADPGRPARFTPGPPDQRSASSTRSSSASRPSLVPPTALLLLTLFSAIASSHLIPPLHHLSPSEIRTPSSSSFSRSYGYIVGQYTHLHLFIPPSLGRFASSVMSASNHHRHRPRLPQTCLSDSAGLSHPAGDLSRGWPTISSPARLDDPSPASSRMRKSHPHPHVVVDLESC
ncbi:hypothetical protein EDB80DRAFT_330888 [Ilyonectria destructans]|nr:hypothetical protein EDB80DRAFT_330888 [Ilyonectria destructans]